MMTLRILSIPGGNFMKKNALKITLGALLAAAVVSGCSTQNSTPTEAVSTASETEAASEEASSEAPEKASEEAENEAVSLDGQSLLIYCGAGMTEPFQEIADAFSQETGCEMNVTYANAGQIQSQITTSEEGDFFIAGSADELTPVETYVASQKDLVKHIPVLAVQAGNPKEITGLSDLTKEGVSLIVGDPEATPIGKIAKKALTDLNLFDSVQITATTATAPQMATAVAAGEADAAITWKENCSTDGVEIVDTADLDNYIKTIPSARLTCSTNTEAADAFDAFLDTDTAKNIWTDYGYEIVE